MTTKFKFGHIVANTRPIGMKIYLDGNPILDSSGTISKTPTIIHNVTEGLHIITFSKPGYDDTTISINVQEGLYTDARAILATRFMRYPYMLSVNRKLSNNIDSDLKQPAPGWPSLPIPQIPYGHLIATTVPDNAEIFIDGHPIYDTVGRILTTPASILGIVVGKHTVTFKKIGYPDKNIDVYIENGLYSDAFAELKTMINTNNINSFNSLIYPGTGDIEINSIPQGAYVYIDGNSIIDNQGHAIGTPVRITGVGQGLHEIQISLDGYYSKKIFLNVIPDRVNDISVSLQSII